MPHRITITGSLCVYREGAEDFLKSVIHGDDGIDYEFCHATSSMIDQWVSGGDSTPLKRVKLTVSVASEDDFRFDLFYHTRAPGRGYQARYCYPKNPRNLIIVK